MATALVSMALLVGACGGSDDGSSEVVVLAAASLADALDDVARAFEQAEPDVEVVLSAAGSSSLREQVLAGAPADVFASADEADVQRLVAVGEAGEATTFARNRLQLAVPAGNEAGVRGLADLARAELLVGLCAEEVPCGRLGREALAVAGVTPAVDTEEPDVRALLTRVEAGELDVGLVYRTDVLAAGGAVEGIDVPEAGAVVAACSIAVLSRSAEPDAASAFVAFVRSEDGQAILAAHGFEAP